MATKQHKRKLLVVDDDENVLLTYRMILEQEGHHVTWATSFDDAMKRLEQRTFDAVICDLLLGNGHTGIEVLTRAKKADSDLPCFLLTGQLMDEAQFPKGITVLHKPVEIEDLLDRIAKISRKAHADGKKIAACK